MMKFILVEYDPNKIHKEWESCKDYKMYFSPKVREMMEGAAPDDQNWMNGKVDDCWDNDEIYQGEDGKFYSVAFDYSKSILDPEPLCWHEVRRKAQGEEERR